MFVFFAKKKDCIYNNSLLHCCAITIEICNSIKGIQTKRPDIYKKSPFFYKHAYMHTMRPDVLI